MTEPNRRDPDRLRSRCGDSSISKAVNKGIDFNLCTDPQLDTDFFALHVRKNYVNMCEFQGCL
jgi:hypothetical protein